MGMISSPPFHGTSMLIDNDSASLYPSMMGTNYGKTAFDPEVKYYVNNKFPFEIKNVTSHTDTMMYLKEDIDMIVNSRPFVRKFDAEYHKLELLVEYHDNLGETEHTKMYNNKRECLEHDHPEWLI